MGCCNSSHPLCSSLPFRRERRTQARLLGYSLISYFNSIVWILLVGVWINVFTFDKWRDFIPSEFRPLVYFLIYLVYVYHPWKFVRIGKWICSCSVAGLDELSASCLYSRCELSWILRYSIPLQFTNRGAVDFVKLAA